MGVTDPQAIPTKKEKDDKETGGGKSGDNHLVQVSLLVKGRSRKKSKGLPQWRISTQYQ